MTVPRVTVCMPVYNNARFLPEAIESVLGQSFDGFQLLIIDDGSTDETREIAERYATRDSRVVLRVNAANTGMVENWNACLREAQGEYVKYLFGDDLLASADALKNMVAVLDADQDVSLVASARYLVDERSVASAVSSSFAADSSFAGTDVINRCLFTQKNLIGEPSVVMFRTSQAGRGFNPAYSQFVDLEMWFHLLEQGSFHFIGEPLASFRLHAGQQTRKNIRDLVHVDEMIALTDEFSIRPYVRAGAVVRKFLKYHQLYRIWKAYKSGTICREEAECKISRYSSIGDFKLLLPLYRTLSPLWKLYCHAASLTKK